MDDKIFDTADDAVEIDGGLEKSPRNDKFSAYEIKWFLYGVACCFCSSAVFSRRHRCTWFAFVVFSLGQLVVLEMLYVASVMRGDRDYADFSSAIALMGYFQANFLYATLAYVMKFFREEIEWGLFQNRGRTECPRGSADVKSQNNLVLFTFIACNVGYAVTIVAHITYAILMVTDVRELSDAKWQYLPNPCKSLIESEADYVYHTVALFSPMFVLMNVGLLDGLFVVALVQEYYLAMAVLWARMDSCTAESRNVFEKLDEEYARSDEIGWMRASDFRRLRDAECKRATENVESVVRIYQKQYEKIRAIQAYIELKFFLIIVSIIICQFFAITGLYSDAFPVIQKFKLVFSCLGLSLVWYGHCYSGKILTDMGDTMYEKVNDIPWYYWDPSSRQVYYIFLCMVQRPIVFQAIGLYDMGMPIFLQVLRLCYTYFQFLNLISKDL